MVLELTLVILSRTDYFSGVSLASSPPEKRELEARDTVDPPPWLIANDISSGTSSSSV